MNKLHKILILFGLISLISNCNSIKRNIVLSQKKTEENVIIRSSLKDKIVYGIKIPNRLEIINKALLSESFIMIDYIYKDSLSNWANRNIELYKIYGEALRRISNNERKIIPSKESLEFIFYTRHFVDSTKSIQQQFKPYVAKMLAENKDTLHIGTVTEFKKKHAALFEKLTKGDSISIQFLDSGKFGERVTVPVEW